MGKTANYIVVGLVILALLGCMYFGYTMYPKINKCPDIIADTVIIKDTVSHTIPDTIPYYVIKYDSIVYHDTVFKDVDTVEILKDYYAEHYYTRYWNDTLIMVTQHDMLSENKFKESNFAYKLLKPVTVINNVTKNKYYSKYITLGVDFPLKDMKQIDVEIQLINKDWYLGVGYNNGIKGISIKGGATVLSW